MFDGYGWAHFLHLTLAALWVVIAVRSDAAMGRIREAPDEAARRARFRVARRLMVVMEMPIVTAMLVVGLMMVAMRPGLFQLPWFHIKLLLVVLLTALFVLTAMRQRRVGDVLADDRLSELPARIRGYRLFRTLMAVIALLLIFVVTNRAAFGAGA